MKKRTVTDDIMGFNVYSSGKDDRYLTQKTPISTKQWTKQLKVQGAFKRIMDSIANNMLQPFDENWIIALRYVPLAFNISLLSITSKPYILNWLFQQTSYVNTARTRDEPELSPYMNKQQARMVVYIKIASNLQQGKPPIPSSIMNQMYMPLIAMFRQKAPSQLIVLFQKGMAENGQIDLDYEGMNLDDVEQLKETFLSITYLLVGMKQKPQYNTPFVNPVLNKGVEILNSYLKQFVVGQLQLKLWTWLWGNAIIQKFQVLLFIPQILFAFPSTLLEHGMKLVNSVFQIYQTAFQMKTLKQQRDKRSQQVANAKKTKLAAAKKKLQQKQLELQKVQKKQQKIVKQWGFQSMDQQRNPWQSQTSIIQESRDKQNESQSGILEDQQIQTIFGKQKLKSNQNTIDQMGVDDDYGKVEQIYYNGNIILDSLGQDLQQASNSNNLPKTSILEMQIDNVQQRPVVFQQSIPQEYQQQQTKSNVPPASILTFVGEVPLERGRKTRRQQQEQYDQRSKMMSRTRQTDRAQKYSVGRGVLIPPTPPRLQPNAITQKVQQAQRKLQQQIQEESRRLQQRNKEQPEKQQIKRNTTRSISKLKGKPKQSDRQKSSRSKALQKSPQPLTYQSKTNPNTKIVESILTKKPEKVVDMGLSFSNIQTVKPSSTMTTPTGNKLSEIIAQRNGPDIQSKSPTQSILTNLSNPVANSNGILTGVDPFKKSLYTSITSQTGGNINNQTSASNGFKKIQGMTIAPVVSSSAGYQNRSQNAASFFNNISNSKMMAQQKVDDIYDQDTYQPNSNFDPPAQNSRFYGERNAIMPYRMSRNPGFVEQALNNRTNPSLQGVISTIRSNPNAVVNFPQWIGKTLQTLKKGADNQQNYPIQFGDPIKTANLVATISNPHVLSLDKNGKAVGVLATYKKRGVIPNLQRRQRLMQKSNTMLQSALSPQALQQYIHPVVMQIVNANDNLSSSGIGQISSNSLPYYAGRWMDPITGKIRLMPKATQKMLNPTSLPQKMAFQQARIVNNWNSFIQSIDNYDKLAIKNPQNYSNKVLNSVKKQIQQQYSDQFRHLLRDLTILRYATADVSTQLSPQAVKFWTINNKSIDPIWVQLGKYYKLYDQYKLMGSLQSDAKKQKITDMLAISEPLKQILERMVPPKPTDGREKSWMQYKKTISYLVSLVDARTLKRKADLRRLAKVVTLPLKQSQKQLLQSIESKKTVDQWINNLDPRVSITNLANISSQLKKPPSGGLSGKNAISFLQDNISAANNRSKDLYYLD